MKRVGRFIPLHRQIVDSEVFADEGLFHTFVMLLLKVNWKSAKMNATIVDTWANTIRLMRKRNKHSLEDIRAVFVWANGDSFWRANILSPDKLRKQFVALDARMRNDGTRTQRPNESDQIPEANTRAVP